MSEYHAQSPKREKRRQLREKELGPERRIVSSCGEAHVLECGHRVLRMATELPHIKRRRCEHCKAPSAEQWNEWLAPSCDDGLPFFCTKCGAGRSIVPVKEVPGVVGECRECRAQVRAKDSS